MKATPLIVNWHDKNSPIYSAHFEPQGQGRLATGGGDTNVRLWRLDADGEDRKVEYLSTLAKHTQTVNVVRWAPKGEILASAGDDGNVILWVQNVHNNNTPAFGEDGTEDKETWRTKQMCRSSGAEIYDLAWSPDGLYFLVGAMDNIAKIYNAQTGQLIRQIAEHHHYVQGVAWDPLNEYIATQSSDRSAHVYSLKTKDGQYVLDGREEPQKLATNFKIDLPSRRVSAHSPAPPDFGLRGQVVPEASSNAVGSPVPSCPGTPTSMALPMNPPSAISHSRRSSFGSSPAVARSASPAPSLPLPAVMAMEASPKPYTALGVKNASLYANDTLKSFFRRLAFTPDGSLLYTPAGQYQTQALDESSKIQNHVSNVVYIYTRGGINRPPIAHLPGHKKPSVVVKFSPVLYTVRKAITTKHITIDTSSAEETMAALPEPLSKASPAPSLMEPPSLVSQASDTAESTPGPSNTETETNAASQGPAMAFSLPYRMVGAVATEDSVYLYDTQQQTPLCIVSNLHCATFTDLTWSSDGLTLLMTSSDGFCSTLTFTSSELGQPYSGELSTAKHSMLNSSTAASSSQNTPLATPTSMAPASPFHLNQPSHHHRNSSSFSASQYAPSPPVQPVSQPGPSGRPTSPTRSNSTSSVATQSSYAPHSIISNPTLVAGNIPALTAGNGLLGAMPMNTPPQTPHSAASSVSGVKRDAAGLSESEREDSVAGSQSGDKKRRRIAPTLVKSGDQNTSSGAGPA
ncbi:WD repeat-containing protein C26H5.03 [Phlyctema vagabunda]|uniref:WD repeat-containing protein C26H5.03 n=1 Tax=Phlyctema vagabunda TaxID=108571 RepID=A0ABR4P5X8_9HELO